MTDETLLKLSAYADGELTDAERPAIEALLASDPVAAAALNAFKKLQIIARSETLPTILTEALDETEGLFALIQSRNVAIENAALEQLNAAALAERIPVVSDERLAQLWPEIALHTTARAEATPAVNSQRWNKVWSGISTRTAAIREVDVPHKSTTPVRETIPNVFSPAWMWAAGVGLAASIFLALWLPHTSLPNPSAKWSQQTASLMSAGLSSATPTLNIPEAQDDHYGVRVRFVPGNSDPIVSLYYKTPARENALMNADFDDRR